MCVCVCVWGGGGGGGEREGGLLKKSTDLVWISLFAIKYVNFFRQLGSSNLTG